MARVRNSESELLGAVLRRDERAWRQFVRRYEDALRGSIRDAAAKIRPLEDDQVDDVLGDLWLMLLEDDLKALRQFESNGNDLDRWLRLIAAEMARKRARKLEAEPEMEPLESARHVAEPAPTLESYLEDVIRRVVREEIAALRPIDAKPVTRATEWLTIARAAEAAGVHTCTIREWIRDGSLKAFRLGRVYRLRCEDLDARMMREQAEATDEVVMKRVDEILAKRGVYKKAG